MKVKICQVLILSGRSSSHRQRRQSGRGERKLMRKRETVIVRTCAAEDFQKPIRTEGILVRASDTTWRIFMTRNHGTVQPDLDGVSEKFSSPSLVGDEG